MSNLRILVVDDDAGSRELIKECCEAEGHQVTTAENGLEGWNRFLVEPFDLVITDWSMPALQGDQLAWIIKQRAPDLPIIITTGYSDQMLMKGRCPEVADLVVGKPLDYEKLRNALCKATESVASR